MRALSAIKVAIYLALLYGWNVLLTQHYQEVRETTQTRALSTRPTRRIVDDEEKAPPHAKVAVPSTVDKESPTGGGLEKRQRMPHTSHGVKGTSSKKTQRLYGRQEEQEVEKEEVKKLSLFSKDAALEKRAEGHRDCPTDRRPFHTLLTAQATVYQQWQSRIMYYQWKKQKAAAGACGEMGGFTRLVASEGGASDGLEVEMPSVFVAQMTQAGATRQRAIMLHSCSTHAALVHNPAQPRSSDHVAGV